MWLKRYHRPAVMVELADKYAVRRHVAEQIGAGSLNELYGVWDDPNRIDFTALPDRFVLKVTWGSGMNIFCRDKSAFDEDEAIRMLCEWMRRSTYWNYREWHYRLMKPRIICERLLQEADGQVPPDFKFHCFNGEPRFIQVDIDRFEEHKRSVFDLEWKEMPFRIKHPPSAGMLPRPANLEELLHCARRLAQGFPFARIDLYSIHGRVVFGEITFYPEGGVSYFLPSSYDVYWGTQLELPDRRRGQRAVRSA